MIELFDNSDNMSKWQPNLLSFEHVSGQPGQVGAVSHLKYKMGWREFDMVETITDRNVPDRFAGTYRTNGMVSDVDNRFEELGPNRTNWTVHYDHQSSGFMMKLMSWLMPNLCKNESQKFMNRFKEFAENEYRRQKRDTQTI